ncbi:MAG: transposase [Bacteroidetes bacterium]|nr:transposase [Bacteroidota bacterium]
MTTEKYQNKYRNASARAQWWDYRTSAPYFVTICTKNREHIFGFVEKGEMHPNILGEYARKCWNEIPNHFSFIELINFVVMPNHVHGLLKLNSVGSLHATTPQDQDPQMQKNEFMANISPKTGSLSSVIRSYKSAVTKYANDNHIPSGWQTRFYDHIVRNSEECQRIFDYINNNPKNWEIGKLKGE